MSSRKPLVIVTAQNLASNCITESLLRELAPSIELVMLVPNLPVDSGPSLRRVLRMIARASIPFLAFKFTEIHVHHFLAWSKRRTIRQLCKQAGVRFRSYASVRADAFMKDLREIDPEYLVSSGPAILSKDILSIPRRATLNCHGARLPEYRGAANYVWMLINGEAVAYPTIQQMYLELDGGPVLAEAAVEIRPDWSAYRLNFEVSNHGGQLYTRTIKSILENRQLPNASERPGVMPSNRGFPGREAIRELRKAGRGLFSLIDILKCV